MKLISYKIYFDKNKKFESYSNEDGDKTAIFAILTILNSKIVTVSNGLQ